MNRIPRPPGERVLMVAIYGGSILLVILLVIAGIRLVP